MRCKLLFLVLLVFIFAGKVYAAVNPSSANWTLYKAYIYTSGNCLTGQETIFDNTSGSTQDFTTTPSFGTSTITDGTYNCVALKISDTVTFQPSANEGSVCTAGTDYTLSVCPSGFSSTDADGGSPVSCTTGDDTVWIYVSTWSNAAVGSQTANSFAPPATPGDTTQGINLGSALEVSGNTTGYFIIDTTGTIATTNTGSFGAAECSMQQPLMSFVTITQPSTS